MALRSFNPDFRHVIGDPVAHIDEPDLCSSHPASLRITQEFNSLELFYRSTEFGCRIKKTNSQKLCYFTRKDRDQVALEDFHAFVHNPNLTVETFTLTVTENHLNLAKLIPGALKVNNFNVRFTGQQEEILPVISHLDPNFLKEMHLSVWSYPGVKMAKKVFGKLFELDQWKNLEKLDLCEVLTSMIPVEHWWNVPRLTLNMESNLDQLPVLINHFRQSSKYQCCEITTSMRPLEIRKVIGENLPWNVFGWEHKVILPSVRIGQADMIITIYRGRVHLIKHGDLE